MTEWSLTSHVLLRVLPPLGVLIMVNVATASPLALIVGFVGAFFKGLCGNCLSEEDVMNDRKLLATGIIGTVIAALCCFTPLLVVLLGAVGLSAWLGWLDYALLPALAFFVILTVFALVRRSRRVRHEREQSA